MASDDESPALYRPRYSTEESSDAAYEKDQLHLRWVGRKNRAVRILLLLVFLIVVGMVTRVYLFFDGIRGGNYSGIGQTSRQTSLRTNETKTLWNYWTARSSDNTFDKAYLDSYGFFNSIPDDVWKQRKQETKSLIDIQDGMTDRTGHLISESGANIDTNSWWSDNWKINFTCKSKVHIAGKWLCDPTRIISIADEIVKDRSRNKKSRGEKKGSANTPQKECLVYISGGNAVEFAYHFLDYSLARMFEFQNDQPGIDLLPCEVHIFSPNVMDIPPRQGLFIHKWGFRPSTKESMGVAHDGTSPIAFKTLHETIAELRHSGRISALLLDCEACEWDMYGDIISLEKPIQQVSMQMHGTPYMANELFLAMQEAGYVIFHRAADGEAYDYSWLKLAPSFFNWKA